MKRSVLRATITYAARNGSKTKEKYKSKDWNDLAEKLPLNLFMWFQPWCIKSICWNAVTRDFGWPKRPDHLKSMRKFHSKSKQIRSIKATCRSKILTASTFSYGFRADISCNVWMTLVRKPSQCWLLYERVRPHAKCAAE